jgi:formate C-acetyltransferase
VGFVGAGLANTADSLLAVETAVFREKRFAMAELLDALKANFEGCESMRRYLLSQVPKWGNNDPDADAMARRVADYYCARVRSFTNGRGGACQAALFTLQFAWNGGTLTGALPDGRKARESLAPGVGATYGRDRRGVTALMQSVTRLDFEKTPNGAVLDVTLHPSAVSGREGLEALVALIKTYFKQGGYAVQFNIIDAETLKAAQQDPERYATLQVRLTGWSVYFTRLSPFEQEQLIARCR